MAELTKKDNVEMVRILLDAYGVGVRAGVLTPCMQDENAFREMFGLSAAPTEVVAQWDATKGVRMPITLQKNLADASAPQTNNVTGGENENKTI